MDVIPEDKKDVIPEDKKVFIGKVLDELEKNSPGQKKLPPLTRAVFIEELHKFSDDDIKELYLLQRSLLIMPKTFWTLAEERLLIIEEMENASETLLSGKHAEIIYKECLELGLISQSWNDINFNENGMKYIIETLILLSDLEQVIQN